MMNIMTKRQQAGLSLVELMVAVVLGMLLMLGVTQVFLGSKTTYVSNQELSQIQESGRFALDILTKDIRSADYKGQCLGIPVNHVATNPDVLWPLSAGAVQGWIKGGAPALLAISGDKSDGFFVQFAVGGRQEFTGASTNTYANPKISWDGGSLSSPLRKDDIAIISDGLGCDLFENDADSDDFIERKGTRNWSHDYVDDFELLRLGSLAYYVADDHGTPTLHRASYDYKLQKLDTHALVQGVEDMKLEYGVHIGGVTQYRAADSVAATDWVNVTAIRITLSLVASSGLQKEFSTLVALRNRLL